MTAPDDDLFALAGLTNATPGHWTPITRTQDFEAQQKATRAHLADIYEPGRSERSMVSPAFKITFDFKPFIDAMKSVADHFAEWADGFQGLTAALERKPDARYDAMTPRDRALAMKNERARTKGLDGTKRAREKRL